MAVSGGNRSPRTPAQLEASKKPKARAGRPKDPNALDRSRPLYLEPRIWAAAEALGDAKTVIRAILEKELIK
jgi:hypothetical protein